MQLSELGKHAESCWFQIPDHFPFVKLGAFVVMPDHIYGIVHIEKSVIPKNKFGPQSKNLGSILRGYKIGVTKNSKLICPKFKWQPRYHDHIIRDEAEYERIHNYIIANPKNWGKPKKKKRR